MPDTLRKIAEAANTLDTTAAWTAFDRAFSPDRILSLLDQQERMKAALERAAVQFAYYAVSHYAKGTADGNEKAAVNAEFAAEMRAALEPTHD